MSLWAAPHRCRGRNSAIDEPIDMGTYLAHPEQASLGAKERPEQVGMRGYSDKSGKEDHHVRG
jgi:hypothetical protein